MRVCVKMRVSVCISCLTGSVRECEIECRKVSCVCLIRKDIHIYIYIYIERERERDCMLECARMCEAKSLCEHERVCLFRHDRFCVSSKKRVSVWMLGIALVCLGFIA